MKLTGALALALLASSGAYAQSQNFFFEEWKGFSAPEIISSGFTHKFDALPMEGEMSEKQKGWSGPYWASRLGGINLRWNTEEQKGWKYSSPSKGAALSMSQEELMKLSATEKYDLYMGNYAYPLRKEAWENSDKGAPEWAGICHGWAPAAIHHNEPTPKVLTNPDGLKVPFGSGDIKALLSYYYAFNFDVHGGQLGLRCYFGSWLGGVRGCNDDLNAGAFHIVMANRLGLEKKGFLMDRDQARQVWNQPVVGFKSQVTSGYLRPSRKAAKAAVREVRVQTQLIYTDEADATWETVMGTDKQKFLVMELQYRLELNANNEIVGGEWESDLRPDFIWDKPKAPAFEGYLSGLKNLTND